jgi:cardiolipin synthase
MARNEFFYLPNLISMARILAAPFLYLMVISPNPSSLLLVLLITGIILSDFLDGALARRLGQTSKLGLILDPLGDKACLLATIIGLLVSQRISPMLFLVLMFKDFAILLGAGILARKSRIVIPSNAIGKWTTALLAFGLALLALVEIFIREIPASQHPIAILGACALSARLALLVGSFLAILSLGGYGSEMLRQLGKNPAQRTLLIGAAVLGVLALLLVIWQTKIASLAALPKPWL